MCTGATTDQQVMIWQSLCKAPDVVEFGVTEFPELPVRTAWADQKQQDDWSLNDPYWVPSFIPDMSSSAVVFYIGFARRAEGHFLLDNALWPAELEKWNAGAARGQK